jgi:hypothetical protein
VTPAIPRDSQAYTAGGGDTLIKGGKEQFEYALSIQAAPSLTLGLKPGGSAGGFGT